MKQERSTTIVHNTIQGKPKYSGITSLSPSNKLVLKNTSSNGGPCKVSLIKGL